MARILALALALAPRPARAAVDASIDFRALARAGALRDVPSGGLDDAAWYAAASTSTLAAAGRVATATNAREILAALLDPTVEHVRVNATLTTLGDDAWPRRGVATRRRVTLRGVCAGAARCAIDADGKSVASAIDGGSLTVTALTIKNAASDFGGAFYLGRGHGGATFDDARFEGCAAREGGAVFVASDASAGSVTFRNTTFVACGATATNGRGGAAFVAANGPAYVKFESCAFEGNAANGLGGRVVRRRRARRRERVRVQGERGDERRRRGASRRRRDFVERVRRERRDARGRRVARRVSVRRRRRASRELGAEERVHE